MRQRWVLCAAVRFEHLLGSELTVGRRLVAGKGPGDTERVCVIQESLLVLLSLAQAAPEEKESCFKGKTDF